MIFLTLDELVHIAERTLGAPAPAPVRDAGLLEAALARPRTRLAGVDVYPGIHDKAAALVHSLVRNHGLIDGNKRLGLVGLVVFLAVNGFDLHFSNDEAFDFISEIADGRLDDVVAIAERIRVASS